MKFWEAMRELEEGKKVRCVNWEKGVHFKLSKNIFGDEIITLNDGENIYFSILVHEEWEIYEEPVKTYTLHETLSFLKEGKGVTRMGWNGQVPVYLDIETQQLKFYMITYAPKLEDLEADDWVVVE